MGYFITAHGGKVAYGVKSFVIDTFKDIYDVPCCEPGSVVYCIETGQRFILDTLHRWNLEEDSGTKGLWIGTEEEFNNLDSYDKDTFYIITDLTGSEEDQDTQDDQEEEDDDVYFVDLTLEKATEEDYYIANKSINDIITNQNKLIVFRYIENDNSESYIRYFYIIDSYYESENEQAIDYEIRISNEELAYSNKYLKASIDTESLDSSGNLIFEPHDFK